MPEKSPGRKITRKEFVKKAAAAIGTAAIGLGGTAKAQSSPNPPNGNIAWSDGKWAVSPTGDPAQDPYNVQWAVSQGGTVLLKAGVFDFGDDASGRRTVTISKGVKVLGETVSSGKSREWKTEIRGGGARLYSLAFQQVVEAGPFYVLNFGANPPQFPGIPPIPPGDDLPVIFDGLRFSGWAGEVFVAEACKGLQITGCSIGDYGKSMTAVMGGTTFAFIHMYMAAGPFCTGVFSVTDNTCEYSDAVLPYLPDDENFGACLLTDFSTIEVSRNRIRGHDEGIEVLANGANQAGTRILIQDNSLSFEAVLGEKWGGHAGMVICGNYNTDAVLISGNDAAVKGDGSPFFVSGQNFTIKGNTARLEPLDPADPSTYPFAFLGMGFNMPMPGLPGLGPSLADSSISNNRFSGHSMMGMLTFDMNIMGAPPGSLPWNETHSVVAYGNDMTGVDILSDQDGNPLGYHLLLAPMTYGNDFRGEFRTALDLGTSAGSPNKITGYAKKQGGIGKEVSDAMRRISGKMRNKLVLLGTVGKMLD